MQDSRTDEAMSGGLAAQEQVDRDQLVAGGVRAAGLTSCGAQMWKVPQQGAVPDWKGVEGES